MNAWCSLKKTCQYRSADEERKDFDEYERKSKNAKFKQKILPSLFKEDGEAELEAERQARSKSEKQRGTLARELDDLGERLDEAGKCSK